MVVLFKFGFRIGEYDGNSSKTWCDPDPRCVKSFKTRRPDRNDEILVAKRASDAIPTEALVDAEAGARAPPFNDGFSFELLGNDLLDRC